MKIFKETFPITDEFTLMLPEDSYILRADLQAGVPCVWFMCDPILDKVPYQFRLVGTGHELEEGVDIGHCKQPRPKGRSFVVELLRTPPLSCFFEVPSGGENSQQAEPMVSNGFSTLSRH